MATQTVQTQSFPVPGHKRRLYTDEQLAAFVKMPGPDWCNVKKQIAYRRTDEYKRSRDFARRLGL